MQQNGHAAEWTCRLYSFPPPAVWTCSMSTTMQQNGRAECIHFHNYAAERTVECIPFHSQQYTLQKTTVSNCIAEIIFGANQLFCFRSDNKQTKSKQFAVVQIINGPNQNIFASIYKFLDYIETFYFAQDNFQTKSNSFFFLPEFLDPKLKRPACDKKIFGPNQNVLLSFR